MWEGEEAGVWARALAVLFRLPRYLCSSGRGRGCLPVRVLVCFCLWFSCLSGGGMQGRAGPVLVFVWPGDGVFVDVCVVAPVA